MEMGMLESLQVRYQFKNLPEEGRPQLDNEFLELSDFCIHDDGMVSAVVMLDDCWNLSILNGGLMDLPFDEGLENKWEVAFLYHNRLFQPLWVLAPLFGKVIDGWNPGEDVIHHLSLDKVNELIPLMKQLLGKYK
jgi:hypothetical protein